MIPHVETLILYNLLYHIFTLSSYIYVKKMYNIYLYIFIKDHTIQQKSKYRYFCALIQKSISTKIKKSRCNVIYLLSR